MIAFLYFLQLLFFFYSVITFSDNVCVQNTIIILVGTKAWVVGIYLSTEIQTNIIILMRENIEMVNIWFPVGKLKRIHIIHFKIEQTWF